MQRKQSWWAREGRHLAPKRWPENRGQCHHEVQTLLELVQTLGLADHEAPFDDGVDPRGQFVVAPDNRRREELLGFTSTIAMHLWDRDMVDGSFLELT